ncbi:MAG: hypothetical protein QNJ55_17345 [Xenococcus sp. MO_188.B8]|nr:hypothetical protein [Xenococcus sp. MO_188.B8]
MSDSSLNQENTIKPTIKVEHQILKEYSQPYYWGNEIKSVIGKVVPGVIKFFLQKAIKSTDAKLITNSCIKVLWRVKGGMSGHNSQQIDALVLGDYVNFEYRSETFILESVELFINQSGDILSDIKLTFLDQKRGSKEKYSIVEIEPMYITYEKLKKMTNLYEFVNNLIEIALSEHQ